VAYSVALDAVFIQNQAFPAAVGNIRHQHAASAVVFITPGELADLLKDEGLCPPFSTCNPNTEGGGSEAMENAQDEDGYWDEETGDAYISQCVLLPVNAFDEFGAAVSCTVGALLPIPLLQRLWTRIVTELEGGDAARMFYRNLSKEHLDCRTWGSKMVVKWAEALQLGIDPHHFRRAEGEQLLALTLDQAIRELPVRHSLVKQRLLFHSAVLRALKPEEDDQCGKMQDKEGARSDEGLDGGVGPRANTRNVSTMDAKAQRRRRRRRRRRKNQVKAENAVVLMRADYTRWLAQQRALLLEVFKRERQRIVERHAQLQLRTATPNANQMKERGGAGGGAGSGAGSGTSGGTSGGTVASEVGFNVDAEDDDRTRSDKEGATGLGVPIIQIQQCSLCTEALHVREGGGGQLLITTTCGHSFHLSCLRRSTQLGNDVCIDCGARVPSIEPQRSGAQNAYAQGAQGAQEHRGGDTTGDGGGASGVHTHSSASGWAALRRSTGAAEGRASGGGMDRLLRPTTSSQRRSRQPRYY
jgi:hypothetical protein